MSKVLLTGDWAKLKRLLSPAGQQALYASIVRTIEATADSVAKRMVDKIKSGDLPANAPSTIAKKGRNTPLIDTGTLVRSIQSRKTGEDTFAAGPTGYNQNAKMSNEDLAAKVESGGFAEEGGKIVEIPPRPFAKVVIDEEIEKLPNNVIRGLVETANKA